MFIQGRDLADDEDGVCHSDGDEIDDEFDEEDIDDLFEQAKKEKSGGVSGGGKSKLSSHLTVSVCSKVFNQLSIGLQWYIESCLFMFVRLGGGAHGVSIG